MECSSDEGYGHFRLRVFDLMYPPDPYGREDFESSHGDFPDAIENQDAPVALLEVQLGDGGLFVDQELEGYDLWHSVTSIHDVTYEADGDATTYDVWFEGHHEATNGEDEVKLEWAVLGIDHRWDE